MAEIISVRKSEEGRYVAEVVLSEQEHLHLKGHTSEICLFSDKISFVDSNISQRGKGGATKYFLIPRSLRHGLDFNSRVSCQKLDFGNKVLFAYVVDKFMKRK